jgi:hypothetical protein
MSDGPNKLDYATPLPAKRGAGWLLVTSLALLKSCGVIGLFMGFLIYARASGDVDEEPVHFNVAVGKAIMVFSASALLLAWWLPRRKHGR